MKHYLLAVLLSLLLLFLISRLEFELTYLYRHASLHRLELAMKALFGLLQIRLQLAPRARLLIWGLTLDLASKEEGREQSLYHLYSAGRRYPLSFLLKTIYRGLLYLHPDWEKFFLKLELGWAEEPAITGLAAGLLWKLMGIISTLIALPQARLKVCPYFDRQLFSLHFHGIFKLQVGNIIYAFFFMLGSLYIKGRRIDARTSH